MIIKALYDNTDECFLNLDMVVDFFEEKGKIVAYTLDAERRGYYIDKDTFFSLFESEV